MGALTRAQVVAAGLNKAGRTDLTTLANTWLNAWLRSAYAGWPWPFLMRRASRLSLPASTTSLSVGAGSLVTNAIHRISDPIWVSEGTYRTTAAARVRQLLGGIAADDEDNRDVTVNRGLPMEMKVRADPTTQGKWSLIPNPYPDRDYLISFDYQVSPADLSSDSSVPPYPNDRTMIQSVVADALQYMDKRGDYLNELKVLATMVIDDRVKFGEVSGTNDNLGLDQRVFR